MKLIGLTGGIACGKSVVCRFFAQKGAFIIDLDQVGHQLLQNTSSVFGQLLSTFGTTILDGDGKINRSKLGEVAPFTEGIGKLGLPNPNIPSSYLQPISSDSPIVLNSCPKPV